MADGIKFSDLPNNASPALGNRLVGLPTGSGSAQLTTLTQVYNVLPVFVASGTGHAKGFVPDPGAVAGTTKFLREDATFQTVVTSAALTVPSILSVTGSPITTSGTFAVTLANQSANQVFAGPVSGAAVTPAFRALVVDDIPGLPTSKITSGTFAKSIISTTGTWPVADIPDLPASKITSGVLVCTGGGVGFFSATPVGQQSTTGTTSGFSAGGGTAARVDSTHTGGLGSTAYTVSDLVLALKRFGLLAS